jgi:hypothetical protein
MASGNYELKISDKVNKKMLSDLNYDRITNMHDLMILMDGWLVEY